MMIRHSFENQWPLAVLILFFAALPLRAHEGGHGESIPKPQVWQLVDGSTIHGSYVAATDSELRLLSESGMIFEVAIARLDEASRQSVQRQRRRIEFLNRSPAVRLIAQVSPTVRREPVAEPAIAQSFKPFDPSVSLRWDNQFLYVESNGLPDHPMMIGIRSWQQQVPLPQAYRGENAWRIPLHPVPAQQPVSAKGRFLRGAIALAVNGIPIFNPLNNRGDDAYLFGELDEFGGHCGRADDYHYHLAPIHLETIVGKGQPIAYALDGYPIYGYQDPTAPDFAPVDSINGHKDAQGNYHYHATPKYPYLNGGFYGVVTEREGQVDPQPKAEPVRPALPPLQGAKVTKFEQQGTKSVLTYEVAGRPGTVSYSLNGSGKADFIFTDPQGRVRRESYEPRRPGPEPPRSRTPGGRAMPDNNQTPASRNGSKPSSDALASARSASQGALQLSSSSITAKGMLSVDCTCDGKRQSPAIAWKQIPVGTRSFAVSLWHTAPDQEKSYWLVYNIPAEAKELKQGVSGVGVIGMNDKHRFEFDPMCSKGPGRKTYHITVYALSQELTVSPPQLDRKRLLNEVRKHGIAQETLDFDYERQ